MNEIYIEGVIGSDVTVASIRAQYQALPEVGMQKQPQEVTLKINSGGGNVEEGFAIYDYLESLKIKVNTEVLGMCGSIATIIQQANFNGGVRSIHKNSKDFIHNPYFPNEMPIPMQAQDALELHEALLREEERILKFYVKHTGKDAAILKAAMDKQTELTAEQAKELNLVDNVLGSEVVALRSYKVVAFYNPQKTTTMNQIETAFKNFEAKITLLLSGKKFKNEMKKTTEGDALYFEAELIEGALVFADDTMQLPAPDGVYTVDDTKYTIKDGKVTGIEKVEAAAADETLKAEIATLKTTLAEKESALAGATNEIATVKAEAAVAVEAVEAVKKEFVAFKAQFTTGTGEFKPEFQSFKGDTTPVKTAKEILNEKMAKKMAALLPE